MSGLVNSASDIIGEGAYTESFGTDIYHESPTLGTISLVGLSLGYVAFGIYFLAVIFTITMTEIVKKTRYIN